MQRRQVKFMVRALLTFSLMLIYAGVAQAATVARPASLTVPWNNATGTYTVSWEASTTRGVTYILQEAINADFTAGLRFAYRGKKTSVAIDTQRAPGQINYYRVMAKKTGFTDSAWRTKNHGCRVLTPAIAPAAITVPATDADGSFTVSWEASSTPGVTYLLQEATDENFTTNLRDAFTGTSLRTSIIRPTDHVYFYRVRALKSGLAGSPWSVGDEGCVVGTLTGRPITISAINLTKDEVDPTLLSVSFHVAFAGNNPVTGLTFSSFRLYMSELVPGEVPTDADNWRQWLMERSSTVPTGIFTDNGGGNYTYQFATHTDSTNVSGSTGAPNPANVQRLSIRISSVSGSSLAVNGFHDFLLADPAVAVPSPRDIVTTAACNSCHGKLSMHGGGYNDTRICVNCHSPLYTGHDMASAKVDMTTMIHQIHSAINATTLVPPGAFDWTEVTYPQEIENCAKCHKGTAGTNWRSKPTRLACGSCHTAVDFATGVGHSEFSISQDNDNFCGGCHSVEAITGYHMTVNKTPNNPDTPAGAVNFSYHIYGVTVNEANQAVVDFAIKKDRVNLSLATAPAGFTGGPSFLLAYALPQDGITTPADYNNLGLDSAQPASVSVTSLIGTPDLVPNPVVNRRYTATLSSKPFPAGATLRAVALQGYFTQSAGTNGIVASTARHTQGVVKAVTGDAVRRTVVAQTKCLQCHEIIEGHGGNRVNNPQLCVTCHNPNLTSSGRTFENTLGTILFGTADSAQWPEASMNFKDLIHGIHGGEARTTPFQFIRVFRGTPNPYDESEVTFPNKANNCEACHKPGTYELPLPVNALNSTNQVAVDGTTAADVTAARLGVNPLGESLPGNSNHIITPTSAACVFCHDSEAAVDHMNALTGSVNTPRGDGQVTEICANCHGPNKWKDVKLVHGL